MKRITWLILTIVMLFLSCSPRDVDADLRTCRKEFPGCSFAYIPSEALKPGRRTIIIKDPSGKIYLTTLFRYSEEPGGKKLIDLYDVIWITPDAK